MLKQTTALQNELQQFKISLFFLPSSRETTIEGRHSRKKNTEIADDDERIFDLICEN